MTICSKKIPMNLTSCRKAITIVQQLNEYPSPLSRLDKPVKEN